LVFTQNNYRIDLLLEYLGKVDWSANTVSLTATSETVRTVIANDGSLRYEVIQRLRGSVSAIKGTINWVEPQKSFTAALDISFGGSHVTRPHIVHTKTLGNAYVLESHAGILTSIYQLNITSGEGFFQGATGGVTVNGFHNSTNDATWVVNAIFWVPPPMPPPPPPFYS
jgi:hypothetical protein